MMNLMFQPLRKFADFEGRARRSEYWLFQLGLLILILLLVIPVNAVGEDTPAGTLLSLVFGFGMLALTVPSLAVSVRRLHDINRTGLWVLINALPVIGPLVLLVLFVLDGTRGPNQYGPDPKGRSDADLSVFN